MNFDFPEGATPIPDCSDLLIHWVQTMADLNRVEAENILQASSKYLRVPIPSPSLWFQYHQLQEIHRTMFGKVWKWAGKQRKSITTIGESPGLIANHIAILCNEVRAWATESIELTFIEKSAIIHHRLVKIHPFENGNGRFARLIADRCLLAWKCPYPIWPDNLHQSGIIRQQYIESLRDADRSDYSSLIRIMKQLGARNPDPKTLFCDPFYRPYITGPQGVAKIRAFLRSSSDWQSSQQELIHSATHCNIDAQSKQAIIALLEEQVCF